MASQDLNVGTAANANDGDTLRAAFIKVRKMIHEIYGSSDTYTDSLDLSGLSFDESIQDIIGAMVSGNTEGNITVTYDDTNGKLNFSVAADTNTTYTVSAADGDNADEEKIVLTGNDSSTDEIVLEAGTGLSITRDGDKITFANTVADSNLTTEEVEDIVGDMLTGNTETGITVTYQDSTNDIDFVVDVDDSTIEIDATNGIQLKDDGIGQAKLGDEFTTTSALSASAVDFSAAAVFTKTLSANTTLTFSNVTTGSVKTLVISGDYTLTLPSGVKTLNGTYSGTADSNVIQIISTNGSTEMFATISNYSAS